MIFTPDEIADIVLKTFDSLEQKRKPIVRGPGVKEWVPLSGVVAQGKDSIKCVALATGMKCLPQSKIPLAQGIVLHDWHAEVLALRTFNRFLLEECYALVSPEKSSSEIVRLRTQDEMTEDSFQPFALKEGIDLHMYCSEAPCGDASMELTMAAQEDPTPWATPSPSAPELSPDLLSPSNLSKSPVLHGRSYFSSLGLVRRKPSRPDAPPTLSKSCSDKIALKQSTSLLSSLTSLLISPKDIYLTSLVLPSSQLSSSGTTRAFKPSGRLSPLLTARKLERWNGGYGFHPFNILSTEREFSYSRRQILAVGEKLLPSNNSAVWTPRFSETLIGGSIQGKRAFSLKGASRVCKRRSWRLALDVARIVGTKGVEKWLDVGSYGKLKGCEGLEERRKVKGDIRGVLGGWIRNEGGEEFGVDGVEM